MPRPVGCAPPEALAGARTYRTSRPALPSTSSYGIHTAGGYQLLAWTIPQLAAGTHTGTADPRSTGTAVALDSWTVS